MKFKLLFAALIGTAAIASAQGYKDGIEYYRAETPEEAEIILTRTLNDAGTDQSTSVYFLGQLAMDNGNTAKAKEYFDRGVALDASNPYNYIGLGELALRNGDNSAAEALFKQARNFDKKDVEVIVEVARAYFDVDPVKYEKDIKKLISDARKADRTSPAIFILEGDILAPTSVGDAAGYYEMAMNSANSASYPEAFVKYARTYFRVNPRLAIERLRSYLDMQPNSALVQRELAEKYYDNNQLTLAAEIYGKYIQNPNHFKRDEQRYVGLLYFGKKYAESNDLAARILAEEPDNFYMKRMRLYNFIALEDAANVPAAAEAFFSATNGTFNANDYTTYGEYLMSVGQNDLAVEQYEKAVAVAPDKTELLKDLSSAYTNAEMFDKAAEAQQKFIDAGDYTTNDLMVLARRYQNAAVASEVGSPEHEAFASKAVEVINNVYSKVPDNYLVVSTRGRILLVANNNEPNEEVIAVFRQMLDMLDADPANLENRRNDYIFVLNQLGKYYFAQGDKDAARDYYTRFLEIDPDNAALREFVERIFN